MAHLWSHCWRNCCPPQPSCLSYAVQQVFAPFLGKSQCRWQVFQKHQVCRLIVSQQAQKWPSKPRARLLPRNDAFSVFKGGSSLVKLTVDGNSRHFHTTVMPFKGMSQLDALLLINCNHGLFNVFQNVRLQNPPEV